MLAHYEGAAQAPDGEWMARLKLVLAAPAIRGEYLKINSEMQEALAEAIATRTGTDIGQDMYPRILEGTGRTTRLRPNGCGCTPPARRMSWLVICTLPAR
jgi:MftR C-terminal domain